MSVDQSKDVMTAEETERALSNMIKQGVSVQIKTTLTEGVFLVGFALLLGVPNTVISLMAAVPSLIQLLQIPAVELIRRVSERKRVNVLTQVSNRVGVLVMVLIPFVSTFETGYILLIGAVGLQGIFTAIGSPSWNSWLRVSTTPLSPG